MIGFISKMSKIVPLLKVLGMISAVATAGYFVYDYFDTKADFARVSQEKKDLEDDVKDLEKDLTKNKINFDTLKFENKEINTEYRDALKGLDELESQLETLSDEPKVEFNHIPVEERDPQAPQKPPTVESVERDINARMNDFSKRVECYTGDKTKC